MGQLLSYFTEDDFEIASNLSDPPPNDIFIDDIVAMSEETFDANSREMDEENLTVDSNKTIENLTLKYINLTLNQVTEIESNLEFYEKVSLVFLLYEDNPFLALQELEMSILGTKKEVLYNWASSEHRKGDAWSKKLIEALCIIQNYEILKTLGYSKVDLCPYFLPTSEYAMSYIDKTRKLLYLACERLTSEETREFVTLVKRDLSRKQLDIKEYGSDTYLEMYLLHWMTINYISAHNVDNIICVFKQMGLDNICDLLKLMCGNIPTRERNMDPSPGESTSPNNHCVSTDNTPRKTIPDDRISAKTSNRTDTYTNENIVDKSLYRDNSLTGSHLNQPVSEERYKVDSKKPGFCIIINQRNFYIERNSKYKDLLPPSDSKPFEERCGTNIDVKRLTRTFKNFGYETTVFENLKHDQIIQCIVDALKKVKDESSVFVCILSHGNEGIVYGVNSCKVSIDDIKNVLCTTNRLYLKNKPKFLILQSCQGQQCQKIDEEEADANNTMEDEDLLAYDGLSSSPSTVDLFTIYATVKGYGAIRNKENGTWFIKSLCQNINQFGDKKHFEDICTSVIRDISSKKWNKSDGKKVGMVPQKESTLRWPFYFPSPIQCEIEN